MAFLLRACGHLMEAKVEFEQRERRISLPQRRGEMAYLDFGPAEALVLFDPVLIPPSEMVVHNQGEDHGITQVALRQRATFPSKAAAFEAYKGRGAFKTWTDDQLTDYADAGFYDTGTDEVTLASTPV